MGERERESREKDKEREKKEEMREQEEQNERERKIIEEKFKKRQVVENESNLMYKIPYIHHINHCEIH